MFTATLLSNAHGADHRKHGSSIVARVRFGGSVFTELFPNNELFWLSGDMSHYLCNFLIEFHHFPPRFILQVSDIKADVINVGQNGRGYEQMQK
jgi:hypothetical protein